MHFSIRSLLGAATLFSLSRLSSAQAPPCNNHVELCGRAYNNITHLGAHDSSFLRDASTGNSVAGNQFFNATLALESGIRLLQAQVHNLNGTLQLCHTLCEILNAGTLETWLSSIKFWMDNHPNDVVTLLLVNSDNEDAEVFGEVFEKSGIAQYGFVPSSSFTMTNWPTLQQLIDNNNRMVVFVTGISPSISHPYLHNQFTYIFETAFEVTSAQGFNCSLDRPSTVTSASSAISVGMLPLINHFLYQSLGTLGFFIPNVGEIGNTNSPDSGRPGSLGAHAQQCRTEWGVKPVFALVDFYDRGPALEVADNMNGFARGAARGRNENAANAQQSLGTWSLLSFLAAVLVLV